MLTGTEEMNRLISEKESVKSKREDRMKKFQAHDSVLNETFNTGSMVYNQIYIIIIIIRLTKFVSGWATRSV